MRSRRTSLVLVSAVFAVFALLVSIPARAVSNRIFMSTNGNNASDCANPLTPCLTFAGALAQVNPNGEVIAEATGGYGAINVTQAVTISGPPGVVIYSGLSVTVNAPGATVVLRGLTIDGTGATGDGIDVLAVGLLHIEGCVIRGFVGPGNQGTSFMGQGMNVNVSSNTDIRIDDTTIRDNYNDGILLQANSGGTTRVTINRSRIVSNFRAVEPSMGARVAIRDSEISYNDGSGVNCFGNAEVWIENCLLTHNLFGVVGGATTVIRLSNSTIANNGTGLSNTFGGTLATRGNNTLIDNTTPTSGPITTFLPF